MSLSALSLLVPDPDAFKADPPTEPRSWSMPGLTELLDLHDFERVLNSDVTADKVSIISEGKIVPRAAYTWKGAATRLPFNRRSTNSVQPQAVAQRLERGATVIINSLHQAWPPLGRLCGQLSAEMGTAVDAVGFLTPSDQRGLRPHWDTESVMLVQTFGSKTWNLWEPPSPAPLAHEGPGFSQADRDYYDGRKPDHQFTLTAGEVLWIPSGWVHSGSTETAASLHVSLGFLPFSRYWLAMKLVQALDRRGPATDRFRFMLPFGIDREPEQLANAISEVVADLAEVLPTLDRAELTRHLADDMRKEFWTPCSIASVVMPTAEADIPW